MEGNRAHKNTLTIIFHIKFKLCSPIIIVVVVYFQVAKSRRKPKQITHLDIPRRWVVDTRKFSGLLKKSCFVV